MLKLTTPVLAALILSYPAFAYDCSKDRHDKALVTATILFGSGILKNDPRKLGKPNLFISDKYWNAMTFLEKSDFAEGIVCVIAGPNNGVLELNFLSEMSGKPVGIWKINRLTIP